jgi:hypothetical protein
LDPVEGAEAAAADGDGSAQREDPVHADAQRLGTARQAVEEAVCGPEQVLPGAQVEDGKVPIVHEEEADYRNKFGDLIHILRIAA